MRDKYILEKCIILKVLKDHPYITRYQIRKKMSALQFDFPLGHFYSLIADLKKKNLISSSLERLPWSRTRPGFGRTKPDRFRHQYFITSEGIRELLQLEFKIQIALTITFDGIRA